MWDTYRLDLVDNKVWGMKFKSKVNLMTPQQELHLKQIKDQFISLADKKYRKGQAEHGGNLMDASDMQLIEWAIDEAIDQIVYLVTLKEKLLSRQSKSK